MSNQQVTVNQSKFVRGLSAIAFLLVLASIAGQLMIYFIGYDFVMGFANFFYLDSEMNIPTFFSMLLLLISSLLLGLITILNQKRKTHHGLEWGILSFGFFVMALDEECQLHEKLMKPVNTLLGNGDLGIFYFSWVIPGIALVVIIGIFFLKFLISLPVKTRSAFLLAATLYLGGAIGFELIGGQYADLYGQETLTYSMISTVEESLEMGGAIIFIWALLAYISSNFVEVQLLFDAVPGEAAND